jgi:glucose-6-phosphate 1-epimerase
MATPAAQIKDRFHIPGIATVEAGRNGLPRIVIKTAAASGIVYLYGAHVTSWRPAGAEELIFLSRHARWEEGKAIRGGIPVCFPWFRAKADNPAAPQHGFVRTRIWKLEDLTSENDVVTAFLVTESDEASRKWWPYEFRLEHRITMGAALRLELIVTNTGTVPFRFEEALHTYHEVGEVDQVRIAGLDQAAYLDNTDYNAKKIQTGDVVFSKATDNAYLDTHAPLEIADPVLKRRIRIQKENSRTTVVWNPWKEGAASLSDLGNEDWRQMACAEASNILDDAVTLPPGRQHRMAATLSVGP